MIFINVGERFRGKSSAGSVGEPIPLIIIIL